MLHGQTLNQITNINGLINRAARQVLLDIDPQETKKINQITGTVFNGVWDYPAPTDLKGNKIIDIRPQILRYPNDVWGQQYNQAFDISKNRPTLLDSFTINFNNAQKSLRINSPTLPPPIIVNDCDSLTSNGTWITTLAATNLRVDNVNFVAASGALEIDSDNSDNIADLYTITMQPVNLSSQVGQGTIFFDTYLPTGSNIEYIDVFWGSSYTDYYNVTVTETQQGTAFQDGWNTIAVPWADAVTHGTPNASSITYFDVAWRTNSTINVGIHLSQVTSNLGRILEIEYYSKYMFRNASTGVFQETVSSNSDLVNLDTDSYNVLLYQCAHLAVQQQQGLDALFFDSNFFLQKYNDAVSQYKASYKSEIQVPQNTYYSVKKGGYGGWGAIWNY